MILLLGATGQLGTAIRGLLTDYVAPPRADLDLSNFNPDRADEVVSSARPDVVVNCAAYTAVDKAEEEEDVATAVNGEAVGVLADVTAGHGIPLITFSTDYVFNGNAAMPYVEADATEPVNAYGRSKLVGERLALEANPKALVIRTSWVISGTHPNFVATMLRLASEGKELTVVDDQHGRPTVAEDLARATLDAVEKGASGLLHLTNEGTTTWFGLARASIELAGHDPELVQPCRTEDYPTPAARPGYSVLGSTRRDALGVGPLPHWQDSLPALVGELVQG
jgi:dTDP-4-dehydrorhamnose reductase